MCTSEYRPATTNSKTVFWQHCWTLMKKKKGLLLVFFLSLSQAGIKIARRNINNLRFADDTILMAENEEELTYQGTYR